MSLLAAILALPSTTLYVSPSGSDSSYGTRQRPLATLEGARAFLSKHEHGAIQILLQPGVYETAKPICWTASDLRSPVSIESTAGALKTVIDGSKMIGNWHVESNGWWTTTVDEVKRGDWYFSELFVNGKRRLRPRLPATGYYTIANEVAPTPSAKATGFDRFGYQSGDIDPTWKNQSDIELVMFHNWSVTVGRIGALENQVVTLKSPTCSPSSWAGLQKGNRYLVDNVREALGRPGEWYLDRTTGQLTYIPLPGESPTTSVVRAPAAPCLFEVEGDPSKKDWAKNLSVKGLTFTHTLWNIPLTGRSFPQAEGDLQGCIRLTGARQIRFDDCRILEVGEYGAEIGASCQDIALNRCTFHDLGAGGIKIGLTSQVVDPEQLTSRCTVENCSITGGGRRAPAAVGVWIGQSPYNVIRKNTIEDFYYTGVSVGWSWGYGPSASHHNLIQDNRIGFIGQNILSDMGGIYTLGLALGTTLSGNYIHDVSSFSYGGWGIYPDEGSSGLLIDGNVATRCKSAGFHQHYGQDNLILNNVFAFNREAQLMRTRAEDHNSFTFEHNVVIWDTGTLLASNWSGSGFKSDNNVFWRTFAQPFDFLGQTLAAWQARGLDTHSSVVNPLFVDAQHDDFRLKKNSPLTALGIKGIDVRNSGSVLQAEPRLPLAWPNPITH